MGRGQVEEITHDGIAFRAVREVWAGVPSSRARERSTPEDDRSR